MPCPHFNITITQRSKNQSAVAGAAYQSGETLFSEYDADCQPKRTPVPYSADSQRHNQRTGKDTLTGQ